MALGCKSIGGKKMSQPQRMSSTLWYWEDGERIGESTRQGRTKMSKTPTVGITSHIPTLAPARATLRYDSFVEDCWSEYETGRCQTSCEVWICCGRGGSACSTQATERDQRTCVEPRDLSGSEAAGEDARCSVGESVYSLSHF